MTTYSHSDMVYLTAAIKLTAVLSRKFDCEVLFGGHPRTDGRRILLPFWDLSTPEARSALYGCVAHEAGGHVRMTDFTDFVKAVRERPMAEQDTFKSILNILEDVRIEGELQKEYPGMHHYLDAIADRYLASEPPMTDTSAYWPVTLAWLLYALRHDVLGQGLLGPHLEACTNAITSAGVLSNPQLDELKAIALKVASIGQSPVASMRLISVAKEVFDYLDRQVSPSQAIENDPQGQPDPQGAQDGPQDQPDPQGAQDDPQGQPGPQGAQDGPQGQPGPQDAGPNAGRGGKPATADTCSRKFLVKEVGDLVKMAAQKELENIPLQTRFRHLDGLSASLRSEATESQTMSIGDLLGRAQTLMSRFTSSITPLLVGESIDHQRLKTGTRIDPRRLCEALISDDPAVFRRRVIEEDESVAIHLLVDTSGSTAKITANGRTVHDHLIVAALALTRSLDSIPEVRTALSCFPGVDRPTSSICHMVKSPDETLNSRMRCLKSSGGTPLDRAMIQAGLYLMTIEKSRRILIVLTDGKPDRTFDTTKNRKLLNDLGIEVVGLVIGDNPNYPREVFDQSVFVTDVLHLPREMLQMVKSLIK